MKTIKFKSGKPNLIKAIIIVLLVYIVYIGYMSAMNDILITNEILLKILPNLSIILIAGLCYFGFIKSSDSHIDVFNNKKIIYITTFTILAIFIFAFVLMIWYYFSDNIFVTNEIIENEIIKEPVPILKHIENIKSIIMAPIAEEIIFRGIIFYSISKINKPIACIISIPLFALSHNGIGVITAFFTAILCTILYIKTEKIILCILSHSLYNFLITLIYNWKITENLVFNLVCDEFGNIYDFYNIITVIICASIVTILLAILCFTPINRHISSP